jgi:hypothetical protein
LIRLDSHAQQVPVVAVFTKFEAFRLVTRNNMIHNGQKGTLRDECEKRFKERYLSELGEGANVVRLEREPSWISIFF